MRPRGGVESIKKRGAFFTPDKYVKISTEYLRKAIGKNKQYIIIDRCAGSGNLEKFLSEEEKKHCLLNTCEYCEWIYLASKYDEWGREPKTENVGKKCQVVPPFNKQSLDSIYQDNEQGNGDALSKEFNEWLMTFLKKWRKENKEGIIIFLENPPFADIYSNKDGGIKSSLEQTSWVYKQMGSVEGKKGLENQFIWSAFEFFLEKKDSYILYAPIKYWKSQHIIDKKFVEGYICNRRFFTDNKSDCALPLIWWKNTDEKNDTIELKSDIGQKFIKKINRSISELNKNEEKGIFTLEIRNTSFASPRLTASITNNEKYGKKKCTHRGLWEKAPLFCAGRNSFAENGDQFFSDNNEKDYTVIDTVFKTGDGGEKYKKDLDFLRSCFLWTCLTNLQQCISNEIISNELALLQNSKADQFLSEQKIIFTNDDQILLNKWKEILDEAEQCRHPDESFNEKYKYGLYQIEQDLCSVVNKETDKFGKETYQKLYSHLNDLVNEFKKILKNFYKKNIHKKLFEYELIK